ncbi:hypothetical protein Talka_00523 [Tepidimonas alkaliphilus]|uniref:Uncharacterized protein n=1 Tax=Tepidimonas alkaliphilus TaxID=2588942 RepID=A0A554WBB0_9BURK|nr:hypothetical protein [Tepidimonas alkaliphilus]TSE20860.1 hypothetical protein Talka_00523 [Tepidimonas alkaliphilus]
MPSLSLHCVSGSPALPAGLRVFERGWLSANNVLCEGPQGTALIDDLCAGGAARRDGDALIDAG